MEEIIKRRDNENDFEFKTRLCIAKLNKEIDLDWSEIVELLNLNVNADHLRKIAYGIKEYDNFIKSKQQEEIIENDDNEIIKAIEEKTKELEKMKIQFQDQKREYKNYLRQDARFTHLQETIIKEIKEINKTKPLISNFQGSILGDREATLILSDLHYGTVEDNYWNKYNTTIAVARLNDLKNQIIQDCKRHSVTTLHIELLGDLVSGYLHVGNRVANEEDVIAQSMQLSELLSEFVNKLAEEIPYVNIYSTIGNHGRCTPNKHESLNSENFEKLIPWYMKSRIQCDNVEFINNRYEDDIIVYNLLNETIFAVHGHQDKVKSVVDDLSKMLKIFPTQVHLGHWHSHQEYSSHDIDTIINGCFSGVDEYAKGIRKTNSPEQTLIIYNAKGLECTYRIKL